MEIEFTDSQLNKVVEKISEKVADIVIAKLAKQRYNEAMTIKEVASYLNKCEMPVRRYIRKTDFPNAWKVGGEFRFDRKEVESWWARKAKESNAIYRP
ncbi:MAG: helix-turn-helix domain-containing protein [Endomicrobium sp.]|nr:helix-turn-helix domain-containing protein [Endomicrobium sp.]